MAFLTTSSPQKTEGNRARSTNNSRPRLSLQAKLRLSKPGDAFEQEADNMAQRVVNTPTHDVVQRQGKEEEETPVQTQPLASQISRYIQKQGMEEEEEESVQTQTEAVTNTDNVIDDPELEQLLASTKSGGAPLDPEILQEMESKFNASFVHVRIHRDSTAT
jgi:hypothetical protein